MPPKRALKWVVFWVSMAVLATIVIFNWKGKTAGIEFITCYAIEWTLSIDNLFVFLMIFQAFSVTPQAQLRALKWGIIGAIILRLVFIYMGVAIVNMFEPILYFFGAILIYSAYKMAFKHEDTNVNDNALVRFASKQFRITDDFVESKFFVKHKGKLFATPLFLVLVTIEGSDVMFAVDSIPAAFAITRDPFIIFLANVFAIMGLRSLYFLISHANKLFRYLKSGVSIILAFVGIKIIVAQMGHHIDPLISLSFVFLVLIGSVLLSLGKQSKS